jgi:hypothetical protein
MSSSNYEYTVEKQYIHDFMDGMGDDFSQSKIAAGLQEFLTHNAN